MQTVTNTEVKAAFGILQAVAEAIRELGEVPSGHLYANLMSKLSLAQFEQVLGVLGGLNILASSTFCNVSRVSLFGVRSNGYAPSFATRVSTIRMTSETVSPSGPRTAAACSFTSTLIRVRTTAFSAMRICSPTGLTTPRAAARMPTPRASARRR